MKGLICCFGKSVELFRRYGHKKLFREYIGNYKSYSNEMLSQMYIQESKLLKNKMPIFF